MVTVNKVIGYSPQIINIAEGKVNSVDISASTNTVFYKVGPRHRALFAYPRETLEAGSTVILDVSGLKEGLVLTMWSNSPFVAVLDVDLDYVQPVVPKQELGSMVITRNTASQVYAAAADPSLATPILPVAVGDLGAVDYKRLDLMVDNGSDGVTYSDGCLDIEVPGTYFTCAAYASFTHSSNSAMVGFGLGIERNGFVLFTSRPVIAVVPNQGDPVAVTGGGFFNAEVGDRLCLWAATDRAGDLIVTSAEISILRKIG